MKANDGKSRLAYLNKLVDEYSNSYHCSGKNPIDPDYPVLTEEIESINKASKLKDGDSVRNTNYKNIFSKDYSNIWLKDRFVTDYVLETNPWT